MSLPSIQIMTMMSFPSERGIWEIWRRIHRWSEGWTWGSVVNFMLLLMSTLKANWSLKQWTIERRDEQRCNQKTYCWEAGKYSLFLYYYRVTMVDIFNTVYCVIMLLWKASCTNETMYRNRFALLNINVLRALIDPVTLFCVDVEYWVWSPSEKAG